MTGELIEGLFLFDLVSWGDSDMTALRFDCTSSTVSALSIHDSSI